MTTFAKHFIFSIACSFSVAGAFAEEVRVNTREELIAALRSAKPGATILLEPGNYRGNLSFGKLRGTKDEPILIAAADPKRPPVIQGGGLHLSAPQYLELRDLVFDDVTGNGLNIDDGGSTDTPAHDITLRNIVVRGAGPSGNRDGIKLSGLTEFLIEGCSVERWGTSGSAIDMVGCHRGVVKDCKIADASGDGANGVQAKGGSSEIVIQRCRFENAGGRAVNIGGSTGLAYIRPADATAEAKDITVEDCEFIGGAGPICFVGVDGALVQHNTIHSPRRWAIRILQENTDPRFVPSCKGRFVNNVVAFRAEEIGEFVNIGPKTAPDTFEFSGNVWHCIDRPADTRRFVRLPVKETGGTYDRKPEFKNAENGDISLVNRKADDAGVRSEAK